MERRKALACLSSLHHWSPSSGVVGNLLPGDPVGGLPGAGAADRNGLSECDKISSVVGDAVDLRICYEVNLCPGRSVCASVINGAPLAIEDDCIWAFGMRSSVEYIQK